MLWACFCPPVLNVISTSFRAVRAVLPRWYVFKSAASRKSKRCVVLHRLYHSQTFVALVQYATLKADKQPPNFRLCRARFNREICCIEARHGICSIARHSFSRHTKTVFLKANRSLLLLLIIFVYRNMHDTETISPSRHHAPFP